MIYLYGLLEPIDHQAALDADLPPGVTGDVQLMKCGELLLLYGAHDGADILPRRRNLLAHARVLETAMALGTVLPMRFGMSSPSESVFVELATKNHDLVEAALKPLRGHVELGVRIEAPEKAALEATLAASPSLEAERERLTRPGAAQHFTKVEFGRRIGDAMARRRQDAQKEILSVLSEFCDKYILRTPESDAEVLRAEFLVPQHRQDAFASLLERAVNECRFAGAVACSTVLLGPNPAFHFTNLALMPRDDQDAA